MQATLTALEPFLADVQRLVHNDFDIQVNKDPWEDKAPEQLGSSRRARTSLKSMFPANRDIPNTSTGDSI